MKLLLLCVLGALVVRTSATDFRFDWDRNPEPDIAGYKLYLGPTSHVYTAAFFTPSNSIIVSKVPLGTFFASVTALNTGGLESSNSVELKVEPAVGIFVRDMRTFELRVAHTPAGLRTNGTVIALGSVSLSAKSGPVIITPVMLPDAPPDLVQTSAAGVVLGTSNIEHRTLNVEQVDTPADINPYSVLLTRNPEPGTRNAKLRPMNGGSKVGKR